MTATRVRRWGPFVFAAAVAIAGWWATWFLCDDAFIAFRYVGNAYDGLGLVWNPPPFQPVEGYTSFLWVALLYAVWLVTGVAPPQSANPIALLCGLGTLWLCARRLQRLPLPVAHEPWRPWSAALVLGGIASNHTFVTWTSSGLETAMFGCWAVAWTLAATAARPVWRARDLATLAVFAALAALTRPDGGLLVLATLAIAAQRWLLRDLTVAAAARGLLPLVLPVLHVCWRRAYYGEWLPNTYYAKVTAAWPESGWRYLYCFAVEHALWLWLWLPLAGAWAVAVALGGGGLRRLAATRFPAAVAVAAWSAHVGYYTLVVGGDHFAYRPFAHLVPLLFLAAFAAAVALRAGPRLVLVGAVGFAFAANSFGWWYERALAGREKDGFVRASTALPAPLGALFAGWDRRMAWLRLHYVALPRGLHAATCSDLLRTLPERRPGQVAGLPAGHRAVYRTVAAGVVSWALGDVVVLDAVGLNDWVVARNRQAPPAPSVDAASLRAAFAAFDRDGDQRLGAAEIAAAAPVARFADTGVLVRDAAWGDLLLALCDRDGDGLDADEFAAAAAELQDRRHMAHERSAPAGYLESLRPNVAFDGVRFTAVPGVAPLTDAEVVAIERAHRERLGR